jgi:hypothetical protein
MRVKHLPIKKTKKISIDCKCVGKEQRNPEVCTVLNIERHVKNAVSVFFSDRQ